MLDYLETFAGGGGWTLGLGSKYKLVAAINHNKNAVRNHKANFPWAEHFCHDMQETHPRQYPKTRILVASPQCSDHSRARGEKRDELLSPKTQRMWADDPTDQKGEKSRALMEQVIHYTREHKYEMIFVENVPEVHKWEHFQRWLGEMTKMGYSHKFLYLNSKFFGVPQSRDRFYAVFWAKGVQAPELDYRPKAPCAGCACDVNAKQTWKEGKTWGIYGANGQYIYTCPRCKYEVFPYTVAASTIIDTSNLGKMIKDRKRPLKPDTMNRIRNGILKLATQGHEQFGISYYGRENTAFPLTQPLPCVTTSNRHALITCPQHITSYYKGAGDGQPITLDKPLWTMTTVLKQALVTPTISSYDLEEVVQHCYFRMLTIDEVRKAMGFPDSYIFEKMPQAAQIKILGNAVTPPVVRWMGDCCAVVLPELEAA